MQKRKSNPMSVGDAAADVLAAAPKLTDEQWAKRDAEVAKQRAEDERAQLELEVARSRAGLIAAGCRIRAVDCALSPYLDGDSQAMQHVRSMTPPGIWCIAGGVGCGKTVAAVWWLHQHAGVFPLFVTAEQFEARGRYDKHFREQWERATSLVLDDLGAEYADDKEHFLVGLDALIDHVSGQKRGMVITTNITGAEFAERYGARIISRIRECGGFKTCADGDRRRKR